MRSRARAELGPYPTLEELRAAVRKLGVRNEREYRYFAQNDIDPRFPADPAACYGTEAFVAFGGWEELIHGKPPRAPAPRPKRPSRPPEPLAAYHPDMDLPRPRPAPNPAPPSGDMPQRVGPPPAPIPKKTDQRSTINGWTYDWNDD